MSQLRRARAAVSTTFFANGVVVATFSAHVPDIREHVGIGDRVLGLALLSLAVGAVGAMIAAAPVSARFGPHLVCRWTLVAMSLALTLVMLAPALGALVPAMMLLGASIGTMDVAMNAVAADVEFRARRPFMSAFHGMFSLGALVGSGISYVAISAGSTPLEHMAATSVFVLVGAWWGVFSLPPATRGVGEPGSGRVRMPRGAVIVIAVIALVVLSAEGAVTDWSALLLREHRGATAAVAALGFGAFSFTMTLFRFLGDAVNARLGPVALVGGGSALAAVGLGVAVVGPTPLLGVLGFAIMGVGLSNTVPVVFSAAAARGRTAAEGLSSVAAFGYLGFLAAPPFIGWVSDALSLPWALGTMAVACGVAALLARAVAPAREGSTSS